MLKIIDKVKNKNTLILLLIVLVGLLMRIYNFEKAFIFAHDQDLYSWIAKDIVVNKHIRSVGQITSVDGVFIGPLYYYIIAFSYWLFNMNPLSAMLPTTIIGLATIVACYFLGKKYFSERVGLIMAFIYAVSYGAATYDRWSVPTEPAILWTVGFAYVVLGMYRKNLKLLPLYAVLVGLTYHIHIALVPILPIPILAYLLSKGSFKEKFSSIKISQLVVALGIFFIVSSPFWYFELKHNFSQVKSVMVASSKELGNPTGYQKLKKVVNASAIEMNQRFLIDMPIRPVELIWIAFIVITFFVYKGRKLDSTELSLLMLWIFMIALAQFTSKRVVSEYYFTNYTIIFLMFMALALDFFWNKKKMGVVIGVLGITYMVVNFFWMARITESINDSYLYKMQLVDFIKEDQMKNGYPCIGINYVADFGTGVGFRYLFWYKGVDLVKASSMVPTYNIIIPWETSASELNQKFGRYGLVMPSNSVATNAEWCKASENKIDELLGYTE